MIHIRKWALVLYLALSFSSGSNSQEVLSTGNLVNFTGTPTATTGNWVNGVYVSGLTCWQPGGPGNCGPYPNVQTNGSINFSYGQVNLNQVVNIKNALSEAGTGVQVSGFHFGFTAKNGNGWDNAQQDYLDAYVKFYNSQGKVVENYDYLQYTNRKYDWSNFNFNEIFNKPYDLAKLSSAQYGFVGRDTNGWAGPYGPEIINVNFSLNYRIDPCVVNPASSPSCPGFSNLVKTNIVVPLATTSTIIAIADTSTSSTMINAGGVQLSTTGAVSAPDNIPQVLKDVQSVTTQSQTSLVQNTSTTQSNKSTPNMSLIMNVLNQVQANDKATQNAAVQNANQVTATSAAKAQEQANQVVEALNTMSQTSSQSSIISIANNTKTSVSPAIQPNTSVVQLLQPTSAMQMTLSNTIQPTALVQPQQSVSLVTQPTQLPNQQSQQTVIVPTQQILLTNQQSQSITSNETTNITVSLLPPQTTIPKYESQQKNETITTLTTITPQTEQIKYENKQQEIEVATLQNTSNSNRGSSINDLFASKINFESLQSEQTTDTVKKNVSANDLAGKVDIASIAVTPKGYELYSFVLKDANFYKAEAIYKDQKTIDNARAFRGLASDRLHQQMVDQQYKSGN